MIQYSDRQPLAMLLQAIEDEVSRHHIAIEKGVPSFEQYHIHVGHLRALRWAEDKIGEIRKAMEKGDAA